MKIRSESVLVLLLLFLSLSFFSCGKNDVTLIKGFDSNVGLSEINKTYNLIHDAELGGSLDFMRIDSFNHLESSGELFLLFHRKKLVKVAFTPVDSLKYMYTLKEYLKVDNISKYALINKGMFSDGGYYNNGKRINNEKFYVSFGDLRMLKKIPEKYGMYYNENDDNLFCNLSE